MVRKKKDPAKDPYREKLTRYHRMIEQAVEDAFTKYSRNINRGQERGFGFITTTF